LVKPETLARVVREHAVMALARASENGREVRADEHL